MGELRVKEEKRRGIDERTNYRGFRRDGPGGDIGPFPKDHQEYKGSERPGSLQGPYRQ
jgi:hypothetical protein